MSYKQPINRQDVLAENTWRLEDLFETDDVVASSTTSCYTALQDFRQYEGKLTTSSNVLYEALSTMDAFCSRMEKIYVYSHMRLHQDSGNGFYQDLASKADKLLADTSTAISFVNPELSSLTLEQFEAFVKETPELKVYTRQMQELLRQKEHILDASTEELLSKFSELGNAPKNIYAMFNNADMKFPVIKNEEGEDVQITHGNFINFLQSSDRGVRRNAFESVYSCYHNFKNTLATTYSSNVKQATLFAKVRKFDSARAASLSVNNIPLSVYDNLIETVNDNLSILHDYFALRKEVLGLDDLHIYDLYLPMVKELDKKITFDEACDIVLKSVAPLGEEYVAILKKAFDSRWIDKYENAGKRSGAYSWGCHDAPHPYVLMNYMDNLDNLFTLAHEMGHALHSYFSHRTQPYAYGGYCIFVAEVASTVNESLLMQYLLKTTEDKTYRKYLINHFMDQFKSTVYRQTMFAELEKTAFELQETNGSLTTDVICSNYYELVKKYHGPHVVVDEALAMEWSRIPHIFNTPFYVYQYATGFSAAMALSNRILTEGKEAVADYLNFLSSGSSKDPIDLLKDAGVDMSTKEPIVAALGIFKNLIEEFKTL